MKILQASLVLVLLQSRVARQLLACLTSHSTIVWSAAPLARTAGWVRDQARQRTAVSAWWPDLEMPRLIFFIYSFEWRFALI